MFVAYTLNPTMIFVINNKFDAWESNGNYKVYRIHSYHYGKKYNLGNNIKIIKIDNMLKYIEYEKIINQMELKIGIMKNT